MLIKNYVHELNCVLGGKTVLIEGVTDVTIHHNVYSGIENGPRFDGPAMPTNWIDHGGGDDKSLHYFVDFTNSDGVRCRLKVTSYAYICNDEGRTVDKIGPLVRDVPRPKLS